MDWGEFATRREKAPATKRVPLCADGDLLRDLEEARATRDKDRVIALEQAVAEATMHVVVRAIDPDDYEELKAAHRPEAESKDEWGPGFPKALVAASLLDPPYEPDGFERTWANATKAERAQLFYACVDLNETVLDLGFTRPDIATMDGIGRSSTTSSP